MWQECFTIRRKTLVTGERSWGWLMCRQWNGEWQYRRMTEVEKLDNIRDTAW
jgi:hypothetical protein